jgi:hypothetical protein
VKRATAEIIEAIRHALARMDAELDPAERDLVLSAIVGDLRSRDPVAVSPLSRLAGPTEPIRDPRTAQREQPAATITGIVRPRARRYLDVEPAGLRALGLVVGSPVMATDPDGEQCVGEVIREGEHLSIRLADQVHPLHNRVEIRRRGGRS